MKHVVRYACCSSEWLKAAWDAISDILGNLIFTKFSVTSMLTLLDGD
jgi:hypothetical protein